MSLLRAAKLCVLPASPFLYMLSHASASKYEHAEARDSRTAVRHDVYVVRLLDEESEIPYYVQLADLLERRIRAGEVRRLPSKRDLIERYGVAPSTVDKAIRLLRTRGVARGVRGKGVFAVPVDELPPLADA